MTIESTAPTQPKRINIQPHRLAWTVTSADVLHTDVVTVDPAHPAREEQ